MLPGYSPHNKEWADDIAKNMNLGHEALVHEWRHWTSEKTLSVTYEMEQILLKVGNDKVNIIAKSVGTRVLMHLAQKISGSIEKTILCGIPTKFQSDATVKLYTDGLKTLDPEQTLIVQNEKDPFAPFEIVEKFVKSVSPKIKIIKKDRSDHNYPYPKDFEEFLKK